MNPPLKSFTFWFAIIGILLFFWGGIMHEKVHQAIFDSYGIESKIALFKDFPSMTTTGEEPCPTEECELAHHLNEAISYNLDMFYWLFYFGFLIIIFILENKGGERNEL